MSETIDTLIIGAGQAGLSLSYYLTQQRRSHLLLDQAAQLADAWRNQRWDSFTLVTPNWALQLPGCFYQGEDPDGFMPRDEFVKYLESYVASFNAPIRFDTRAIAVDQVDSRYQVQTSQGDYLAANIVIASGFLQQPRIPPISVKLSPFLSQLHSSQYCNPAQLLPGAVLVVGSAQSGCQIAEELYQSGRQVYLSIGGSSGRAPRRYRGKDTFWWFAQSGSFDRTVDQLTSSEERFGTSPHLTGKDGGHSLNLHKFVREGVILLGRITGGQADRINFALDLQDSLLKIDQYETNVVKEIDEYIAKNDIPAPEESLEVWTDGYQSPDTPELDLAAAGISTLIWATGYRYDFSWVHLPVFNGQGFPIHQHGATDFPGLCFLGLPWQNTSKSGTLFGVDEDAAYIASHLAYQRA